MVELLDNITLEKVTSSSDGNSHYIKYSNGLIICWGKVAKGSNLSAGSNWNFSFQLPIAFTSDFVINGSSGTNHDTKTASGAEIAFKKCTDNRTINGSWYCRNNSEAASLPVLNWIAIGF